MEVVHLVDEEGLALCGAGYPKSWMAVGVWRAGHVPADLKSHAVCRDCEIRASKGILTRLDPADLKLLAWSIAWIIASLGVLVGLVAGIVTGPNYNSERANVLGWDGTLFVSSAMALIGMWLWSNQRRWAAEDREREAAKGQDVG